MVHLVLEQILWGGQEKQTCPPVPQAESLVPGWHWLSLQHPWQVVLLQYKESLQVPKVHFSQVVAHCLQGLALSPQAAGSSPDLQVEPSQHPSGQEV
jgi:hypothetical protein